MTGMPSVSRSSLRCTSLVLLQDAHGHKESNHAKRILPRFRRRQGWTGKKRSGRRLTSCTCKHEQPCCIRTARSRDMIRISDLQRVGEISKAPEDNQGEITSNQIHRLRGHQGQVKLCIKITGKDVEIFASLTFSFQTSSR